MDKLYCKLDELAKLNYKLDELDKLDCKFDELDKLYCNIVMNIVKIMLRYFVS